jgi:hypothetical protein
MLCTKLTDQLAKTVWAVTPPGNIKQIHEENSNEMANSSGD